MAIERILRPLQAFRVACLEPPEYSRGVAKLLSSPPPATRAGSPSFLQRMWGATSANVHYMNVRLLQSVSGSDVDRELKLGTLIHGSCQLFPIIAFCEAATRYDSRDFNRSSLV